ncbi:MAG: hypothetical protein D6753_10460 [Planctomycetota bacterium]|nr:MAG: hypothetical protein D6753_10460 [Planctomycetota bacterium]
MQTTGKLTAPACDRGDGPPQQANSQSGRAQQTTAQGNTSRRLRWTVCILVLALVLRLAFAVYWDQRAAAEGRMFRLGDSHTYWTLAQHIVRGEPYQYGSPDASVFRAPLYPIFLAMFACVPDQRWGILAARCGGAVAGTVAVYLLSLIAGEVWASIRLGEAGMADRAESQGGGAALEDPRLWAAAIGAIYPSAIGMSVTLLSEAIFLPLMLLHLWAWIRAWNSTDWMHRRGWSAVAGVAWGLAVLARPSWLLFAPFLLLGGILLGPQRRRHAVIFGLACALFCLTMAPWWIRNFTITGRFVPTTLQVGPSLYDGLHPGATGASDAGMAFMQDIYQKQIEQDQQSATPPASTLEYRLNRRATHDALAWAAQNSDEVVRLAKAKFLRTWALWPDGGEIGSTPLRIALSLGTFTVLALAVIESMLALRRWNWVYSVCWLPCIYFTLLHMVFVGSIRYREPAVFVLAALAGNCLARIGARWANSQGSMVAPRVPSIASSE